MSEVENHNQQPDPTIEDGDGSSVDPNSIEGLFLLALQKESGEQREAYLDDVCGDDAERRRRVTALLRAYDDAGSFLDTPVGGARPQEEVSLSFLRASKTDDCLGTLGPYEVLDVIGRGGMGIVLRGLDPKLNRVVAIKVLLPQLAANPNARRRFLREAQAAAAVSHPHVVTIHAVEEASDGENPTPPYLVMECVVGQSLQEKLDSSGSLRLEETLRISRQIAAGLVAAHKQGLIHRDIKPANILLENGVQRVTITDFGLARATDDLSVTRTGEVSGTPQYMSPEQASGQRVDHRSDLFSLGCVMYAMCTGHSPFRAESLAHVIKRVTQDTPRPIAGQNPEVPPWLTQIIDCLLEKGADKRIQSAEDLVAILDQHLARIQQPTDSGSHALINQQLPTAAATSAQEPAETAHLAALATAPDATRPQQSSFGQYFALLLFCGISGAVASLFLIPGDQIDDSPNNATATLFRYSFFMLAVHIGQLLMYKVAYGQEKPLMPWLLLSTSAWGAIVLGFAYTAIFRMQPIPRLLGETAAGLTFVWIVFCIYVAIECCTGKQKLLPDALPEDAESIHGKVGRYLLSVGSFLVVFPFAVIAIGLLIGSGDFMQFGGQVMVIALPLSIAGLIFGYVLRYIIDKQPQLHRSLNLRFPIILACGLSVAAAGAHVVWEREMMRSKQSAGTTIRDVLTLTVKHPPWDVRQIGFAKAHISTIDDSPTETRLIGSRRDLGMFVDFYVILKDGREHYRHAIPIRETREIEISEDDLSFLGLALVEVINDIPDEIDLTQVVFTTQTVTQRSGFYVREAPFHKTLQPGEHRITIRYERKDWKIPEGYKQFAQLDFRTIVPDAKPIKLSLKKIMEENGASERIYPVKIPPADYRPLDQME